MLNRLLIVLLLAAPLRAEITGVVIDRDGAPLRDCAVAAFAPESHEARLQRIEARLERVALRQVTTRANGTFALGDTESPFIDITATCAGAAPQSTRVRGRNAEAGALAVVRVPATTHRLIAEGRPLPDATVVFLALDGAEAWATTDRDGAWSVVDANAWADELIVIHPDRGIHRTTRGNGSFAHQHTFDPRSRTHEAAVRTLSGVVRDAGDRHPLAGLELHLAAGGAVRSAITGDDGSFRIARPDGEATFTVAGLEYTIERTVTPEEKGPLELFALPTASVSGRVVSADGDPIAGAVIAAAPRRVAYSGPDGRFLLRGLDGPAALEATRAGFASASTPLLALERAVQRRGVTLVLDPLVRVKGLVREEHAPIANASLVVRAIADEAVQRHAQSDAEGAFLFELAPGAYEMTVMSDGHVAATRAVTIASGAAERFLEVVLARGIELAGTIVRSGSGDGVAGVTITAAGASSVSDGNGRFALRVSEEPAQLTLDKRDELLHLTRAITPPLNAITIDVPEPRTVHGRVIDRLTERAVDTFLVETRTATTSHVVTGSAGAFSIALPAGQDAEFRIDARDYVAAQRTIAADAREVELALERAAVLTGRTMTAAGQAIGEVEVSIADLQMVTRSDSDGSFTLSGLPRGAVRAAFAKAGYRDVERELQLPVAPLTVVLESQSVTRGVVTGEDGRPVAAAMIEVRESSRNALVLTTTSAADGHFTLARVSDGPHTMRVFAPGYEPGEQRVEISLMSELSITLRRATMEQTP
jgi:Carboxypeptidase regulatory-like domain